MFEQHCYFAFLYNADAGHLTGINRKGYSRPAQCHQSCSKQRLKSTAIHRRSVRMNSIYRGFTGENDEECRVQNTLSFEQHLLRLLALTSAHATTEYQHLNHTFAEYSLLNARKTSRKNAAGLSSSSDEPQV
ncbi:Armadillo-like helical domain containing protein [Dorcoceras hygrometricum]|uniref:Armadillo-like helical domain containing protein n=1 Tax=Dorcoceras hygrometricum TaxID=472368 RepID=A0A2Z7BIK3_9LAMI|nr:Armadillo-like helical domain containing protein [Dorcoceras hygrometricum]